MLPRFEVSRETDFLLFPHCELKNKMKTIFYWLLRFRIYLSFNLDKKKCNFKCQYDRKKKKKKLKWFHICKTVIPLIKQFWLFTGIFFCLCSNTDSKGRYAYNTCQMYLNWTRKYIWIEKEWGKHNSKCLWIQNVYIRNMADTIQLATGSVLPSFCDHIFFFIYIYIFAHWHWYITRHSTFKLVIT